MDFVWLFIAMIGICWLAERINKTAGQIQHLAYELRRYNEKRLRDESRWEDADEAFGDEDPE